MRPMIRLFKRAHNIKPTGGESDSQRDPEPTVRRKHRRTEGIANSHFPAFVSKSPSTVHFYDMSGKHTTCQPGAAPTRHKPMQARR
jgi:hypothetical protein